MLRRLSLLALGACLLLGTASAQASSVALAGDTAVFSDADGLDDTVTLKSTDEGLRIYDNAEAPLIAGAGCTQVSKRVATCAGAAGLRADCGDGFDQIIGVDRTTFLSSSCESIRTNDEELLTMPAQPLAIGTRSIAMRINCPDYAVNDFGEYVECAGTARLWRKGELVAQARFDIASGVGKRVNLRLTKLGRRLVGRTPLQVLVAVEIPGDTEVGLYPARARWAIRLPAR